MIELMKQTDTPTLATGVVIVKLGKYILLGMVQLTHYK